MSEQKKALKSGELKGSSGFFSSLGFEDAKKKKPEEKKADAKIEPQKKEEKKSEIKAEDLLNASLASGKFGNARVVRQSEATSTRPNTTKSRTPHSRPRSTRPSGGRSNTGRTRTNTRSLRQKPTIQKIEPNQVIRKKEATVSSNLKKKESIIIGSMITVKEFSEKMGVPLPEIMSIMIQNQILGGINTALDFDTASLIAEELEVKVEKEQDTVSVEDLLEGDLNIILEQDKEATNTKPRAPIITIMGHVDHGKTTLLDYLRKTNVADGEAGGITQSIGASTIIHNDKQMAFIDTPGHELFTTMRARGAKLTDIVVIVVAADDGIMPQTAESINHAKESGVPIIIAITKIDKPGANKQEQIKADLGKFELIPEERGGDVPVIGVSGKTGKGIDELLEHITLQAEVLELKYNPERKAVGVVIDAKKSARQGIETSLIIMTGTLKVGDVLAVHNTYGKVKRMLDRTGKPIKEASGGDPVLILGINETPEPGRIAEGVKNEKEATQKIAAIKQSEEKKQSGSSLQALLSQMEKGETTTVKLILKADGPTALEALEHAIDTIETPENVKIKKVHTDIGQFTDSDITLAEASGALLIGFNIKTTSSIKKKAEQQKITLKTYDIIYELTEYIEDLVMGLIEVEMHEVTIGRLQVLAVFFRKAKDMVIGGKIIEGKAINGGDFRIHRGEEIVGKGKINSLQKEKQSVKEVTEGHECGMKVKVSKKIEEGDILEFFEMQEVT